jgi:hypothetical protein
MGLPESHRDIEMDHLNHLTEPIIGCAIEVHRVLGPGLLEATYEQARVIVEIKSVDRFDPVFQAQMLTYLRATGKKVGLLINFNSRLLHDGVERVIL